MHKKTGMLFCTLSKSTIFFLLAPKATFSDFDHLCQYIYRFSCWLKITLAHCHWWLMILGTFVKSQNHLSLYIIPVWKFPNLNKHLLSAGTGTDTGTGKGTGSSPVHHWLSYQVQPRGRSWEVHWKELSRERHLRALPERMRDHCIQWWWSRSLHELQSWLCAQVQPREGRGQVPGEKRTLLQVHERLQRRSKKEPFCNHRCH